jgi:hypothetical protein
MRPKQNYFLRKETRIKRIHSLSIDQAWGNSYAYKVPQKPRLQAGMGTYCKIL